MWAIGAEIGIESIFNSNKLPKWFLSLFQDALLQVSLDPIAKTTAMQAVAEIIAQNVDPIAKIATESDLTVRKVWKCKLKLFWMAKCNKKCQIFSSKTCCKWNFTFTTSPKQLPNTCKLLNRQHFARQNHLARAESTCRARKKSPAMGPQNGLSELAPPKFSKFLFIPNLIFLYF